MRYADLVPGMYVVRTKDLNWARKLSGVICQVDSVGADGSLMIRRTEDCIPVGPVLKVDKQGDDGYWYDVSELTMYANSVIAPPANTDAFSSPVESNYRNFVDIADCKPLTGEDACNRVCFVGERNQNGKVVYGKTGYYVIGMDVNGYAIAYKGFCEFQGKDSRHLSLSIINLTGMNRYFYEAAPIVAACRKAYQEDMKQAQEYRHQIQQDTIGSSTEIGEGMEISGDAVRRMVLDNSN